jgi:hypothetical protein
MIRTGTKGALRHRVLLLPGKALKPTPSLIAIALIQRLQKFTRILFDQTRRQSKGMLRLCHRDRFIAPPQFSTQRMNDNFIVGVTWLVNIGV